MIKVEKMGVSFTELVEAWSALTNVQLGII